MIVICDNRAPKIAASKTNDIYSSSMVKRSGTVIATPFEVNTEHPKRRKNMTTISGTTYSGLYSYESSSLSDQLDTNASSSNDKRSSSTTKAGDSVTLSSELTTAKTREYLGLTPTGRLSLGDFKTAATDQEDAVSTMLSSAMETLGIDGNQKITLSLDNDNNIVVEEDFPGKSELEDALNEDNTFMRDFRGLSANNEVLDYVNSLQTNTKSFFDYMNAGINDEDLMALATKYSTIKSGGGSIETVWSLSRSETPYSYTYSATQ